MIMSKCEHCCDYICKKFNPLLFSPAQITQENNWYHDINATELNDLQKILPTIGKTNRFTLCNEAILNNIVAMLDQQESVQDSTLAFVYKTIKETDVDLQRMISHFDGQDSREMLKLMTELNVEKNPVKVSNYQQRDGEGWKTYVRLSLDGIIMHHVLYDFEHKHLSTVDTKRHLRKYTRKLLGVNDNDIEKILELQTKVGRCHGTPSEKRNSAYFQMDFENLPKTLKYIFESYLPEEESVTFFVEKGLLDFFEIIQEQNNQNEAIVCLYFKFLIMNHFAPFSSKHRKSWSDFHEIFLNGTQITKTKEQMVAKYLRENMADALITEYKHHYFDNNLIEQEKTKKVDEIIQQLKTSCVSVMHSFINNSTTIPREIKEKDKTILEKWISSIQVNTGFQAEIEQAPSYELQTANDSVFDIMRIIGQTNLKKFFSVSDRGFIYPMNMLISNACYCPGSHAIIITASMLHDLFYGPAMCCIIGHEIAHSVDDHGIKRVQVEHEALSDHSKNLFASTISEMQKALQTQYTAAKIGPDDAMIKLGEFSADWMGLIIATKWFETQAPDCKDLFLCHYSCQWLCVEPDVAELVHILGDQHPQNKLRVNLVLERAFTHFNMNPRQISMSSDKVEQYNDQLARIFAVGVD